MNADDQAAKFQARKVAFYAAHAPTCEQLEIAPGQLRNVREIELSGRKLTCESLGFFPAPEIVYDRSEGLSARPFRTFQLPDLERERAAKIEVLKAVVGPQVVEFPRRGH